MTGTDAVQDKPIGQESTRLALIEATIELISQKGPDGFSVREVAALANVNHGLIHRHFGGKPALVEATFDEVIHRFSLLPTPVSENLAYAADLFRALSQQQHMLQCIIWIILSDYQPKTLASVFPALQDMTFDENSTMCERRVLASVLTSAVVGWHIFKPLIAPAVKSDIAAIETQFGPLLDRIRMSEDIHKSHLKPTTPKKGIT